MKKLIIVFLFLIIFLGFEPIEYVINNDERFTESEVLGPPAKPIVNEADFDFLVIADMHNKYFATTLYDFVMIAGDSTLNGFEKEYRAVQDLQSNFYYAIGNHELDNGGWQYWKQYIGYSTHYYWEIGSLCLIVMDTASVCYNDGDFGDLQYDWLEDVLENTTCPNKVIITHINMMKLYGQSRLADLCIDYDVKAFVSGHTHNYAWDLVGDTRCFTLNDYNEGGSGTYLKIFVVGNTLTWQIVL